MTLEHRPDLLQRAEPRICAFDIETTKLPLQFPNAEYDQVKHNAVQPFLRRHLTCKKPCMRQEVSCSHVAMQTASNRAFDWKTLILNCLPVTSGAATGVLHEQLFCMLCSIR